jgi:uncharacterized cupredoxin-like copper-binding protein
VRSPLQRRAALLLSFVAASVVSACGHGHASKPAARVVHIEERDFKISAPKRVSAGDVDLEVENHGPDDHELIVVRAGAKHVPFRADDVTLDEDAAEDSIAGALEPGDPGTRHLRVHLKPGRYVLFCNMTGHYLGGMDRDLEVR